MKTSHPATILALRAVAPLDPDLVLMLSMVLQGIGMAFDHGVMVNHFGLGQFHFPRKHQFFKNNIKIN